MGFSNPVTGGQGALVRPAIKSPQYQAGVQGWSINRDGSAEFNNGVFRGTLTASTFEGTDFLIETNGAFFYSGAPAAGNLIASICPTATTDGFGNAAPAGVATFQPGTPTLVTVDLDGIRYIGTATNTATQFDVTHASFWALNSASTTEFQSAFRSGHSGVQQLYADGNTSGGPTAASPSLQFQANGGGALYASILGALVGGDQVNGIATWQNPAYTANWATSTTFNGQSGQMALKFRKDNENGVRIIGTAAATTGAGASPFTLPAGYRPTLGSVMIPAMQFDPTGGKVITAMVRVDGSGNCTFSTAQGFAAIVNGTQVWIDGTVPLGDIP